MTTSIKLLKRFTPPAACLLLIACGAALDDPAAQEYMVRTRFAQAAGTTDFVEMVVTEYYIHHDAWPASIEQAAKEDPHDTVQALPTKEVQSIALGANGELTVTFRAGLPELGGKSFVMSPLIAADGSVSWKCSAPAIPEKYRTTKCKVP